MRMPENTQNKNPMDLKVIREKLTGPKDLKAFTSKMESLRKVCKDNEVCAILLVSEMEPLGAYDVFNYCIVLKTNFPKDCTIVWVETKVEGNDVQRFIKHVFESGAYLKAKMFTKETDAINWIRNRSHIENTVYDTNRSLIVIK